MLNVKFFEMYFLAKTNKYEEIKRIIRYYCSKGKTLALWGAGIRGTAFLNIFDPQHKFFKCVFDKDVKKHGMTMPTGHLIIDARNSFADVVFLTNYDFELETVKTIQTIMPNACILNIEDVILGNLTIEQTLQFFRKRNPKKIRNSQICAMVILYNPDRNTYTNIESYAHSGLRIYIFDNSPQSHEAECKYLKQYCEVVYIYSNGKNYGICYPINQVACLAANDGFEWLITFDQDSAAKADMVLKMREYVNSTECDDTVGAVVPMSNSSLNNHEYMYAQGDVPYLTYVRMAIQSGMMHNLKILQVLGGYNEDLFIDQVDHEYCVRCRANGYKIVRLNRVRLLHQQNDEQCSYMVVDGVKYYKGKYSSMRYYYQYRNLSYCLAIYEGIDSIYADYCRNELEHLKLRAVRESDSSSKQDVISKAEIDALELIRKSTV